MAPFIVFTLPRSRSAWLSHFLDCGHDLALDSTSISDFLRRLDERGGTVETGSIIAAKVIRKLRPDIRMATVRRPTQAVLLSLLRFGLKTVDGEIEHRADLLDELAQEPDVLSLDFADLNDFAICCALHDFCIGQPCSREKFEHYSDFNIQLNIPRRVKKILATAEIVKRMKEELRVA